MQEYEALARKHAEADRTAQTAQATQQHLQDQLARCADKSVRLQRVSESTVSELTANQQQVADLQEQVRQVRQQLEQTARKLSVADSKLRQLEPLPPQLARVSNEAEVCRREMSTLTGSQAKVHESLQAYLRQEKELRQGLAAAEQHLSRLGQDYAVCQDTSAHLHSHAQQTKVGAADMEI